MIVRLAMIACGIAIAVPLPAAARPQARWTASWAASPEPSMSSGADAAKDSTRSFRDQTVSQVVRLSAGGSDLRIRLTNEYGEKPLEIGEARVSLVDAEGRVVVGTERTLTFADRASVTIPAGSPWLSDPVALRVPPRARLQVRLYLPGDTGPCTCHVTGNATAQISPPGNYTGRAFTPAATFDWRAFISEVDVLSPTARPVVVAFGDSITDGYLATIDADRRWPDRLAERLAAEPRLRHAGVVNAGIGGNRVLKDGHIAVFGQSAIRRFDRDVLSVPGASTVIVLEGINDIGIGASKGVRVTAEELIGGYRQLIARARAKGMTVIGGTLIPYEGATYYYRPEGEAVRQAVNSWIRTSGAFDGVVDFDQAVRDPARPTRMRADLQSGDWLHPNDAGYRVMGNAISLALLR